MRGKNLAAALYAQPAKGLPRDTEPLNNLSDNHQHQLCTHVLKARLFCARISFRSDISIPASTVTVFDVLPIYAKYRLHLIQVSLLYDSLYTSCSKKTKPLHV